MKGDLPHEMEMHAGKILRCAALEMDMHTVKNWYEGKMADMKIIGITGGSGIWKEYRYSSYVRTI
ncbi:MAG: hypothetical protein ACLTKE_11045 [Coprococcus sp.]